MFVAASTNCFHDLEFDNAVEKILDLEFSAIELNLDENGSHIKPSEVLADFDAAIDRCSSTRRLNVVGYDLNITSEGAEYMDTFTECCKLAKATKVVSITVRSGEHGTPFNEEVEKLKKMVDIADAHGVRVGIRSEVGHLSADPDTVSVICSHVKGLGLSLDPTHYVYKAERNLNYDKLLGYVQTVYLRDSTKEDKQVRVGQGIIDYGKLINQLRKTSYKRALVVDIDSQNDETDHMGEMRKMRLLLESLLVC